MYSLASVAEQKRQDLNEFGHFIFAGANHSGSSISETVSLLGFCLSAMTGTG